MSCPCASCQGVVNAISNDALADWLMARMRKYVPGRTGYDWDERDMLTLIASRLRAQPHGPTPSPSPEEKP